MHIWSHMCYAWFFHLSSFFWDFLNMWIVTIHDIFEYSVCISFYPFTENTLAHLFLAHFLLKMCRSHDNLSIELISLLKAIHFDKLWSHFVLLYNLFKFIEGSLHFTVTRYTNVACTNGEKSGLLCAYALRYNVILLIFLLVTFYKLYLQELVEISTSWCALFFQRTQGFHLVVHEVGCEPWGLKLKY